VLIRSEEAESFLREYASLFELAKECGENFKAVKAELAAEGVEPASKEQRSVR